MERRINDPFRKQSNTWYSLWKQQVCFYSIKNFSHPFIL